MAFLRRRVHGDLEKKSTSPHGLGWEGVPEDWGAESRAPATGHRSARKPDARSEEGISVPELW